MNSTYLVSVYCRISNGLKLTLGAATWSPHPLTLHEREPIVLRPGVNSIPRDYWRAWLSDHLDADIVENRFVYELEVY